MAKRKVHTSPVDSTQLILADDCRIHPDLLIGNGNGIFGAGAQNSGKSVTLKLLLEQLAQKANIPLTVFDKEEDLLATADLFPRGFVARYNNCPTAKDIYGAGLQVVFDLTSWPNTDIAGQMIARMVNSLMREAELTAPQWRVPLVVGMDEASYWLPQERGKSLDEDTYKHLKDAFEAVASRGRKRGLVPFLFTQKFSTVNKDVLSPGTYILMRQATHTEQSRYLDYILPLDEFKYFNERQKKNRISDLRSGEAIVRFADGSQRVIQFHHCQSPHVAHTPKTQVALARYAGVTFNRDMRYGSYIEDEAMEVSSDEPARTPDTDQLQPLPPVASAPEQPRKPKAPRTHKLPENSVAEPRVRAALAANPNISDKDLALQAKCSFVHAKLWKERIAAEQQQSIPVEQPPTIEATPQITVLESRASEPKKRRVKKAPAAPVPNVTLQIHAALEHDEDLSPMELVSKFGCDLETAKQARMGFFYGGQQ
jgi:hypothetical protein